MHFRCAQILQSRPWLTAIVLLTIGLLGSALGASAQAQDIVQVEEDWELIVGTPDPAVDAPQISCGFSPLGNIDTLYTVIEVNHRSQTSFAAGGLQLQVWYGDYLITAKNFSNNAKLSTAGEQVTWTQRMTLSGGMLTVEVVNGSSTTWGAFGGQGFLKANTPTTLANLNAYHPDVSAGNSGVGFAGNRVQSLTLKEVRFTTSSGNVLTDSTPRVVHQQ